MALEAKAMAASALSTATMGGRAFGGPLNPSLFRAGSRRHNSVHSLRGDAEGPGCASHLLLPKTATSALGGLSGHRSALRGEPRAGGFRDLVAPLECSPTGRHDD